ncbi:unnamed protein product [Brassicogethes aeneus]|uniref:AAA+ ATPase domain-containing protein n=1 Tax=Brassicogethes aeneus TaxID=1431903 RepID=A0A9P0FDX2_BRAAE|nr:unnamed protein product [Brassicogethes aeneus]
MMNYNEILDSYKKLAALISNPSPDLQYPEIYNALGSLEEDLNLLQILTPSNEGLNGVILLKDQVVALLNFVAGLNHMQQQQQAAGFGIPPPRSQSPSSDSIDEPITSEQLSVKGFKDIAGMWELKEVLKMMVILPKKQPQLFENRRMTNSLLLFGPPGTGKTKIVHGIAAEANCSLFAISVADIMQKYLGESEKTIKNYFEMVRNYKGFSILFFDEIDSISQRRGSRDAGYSRRVLTEFMCQMNKLEETRNCLVVAATNCPWDLDPAVMRRFQRRVYCPLPDDFERYEIIKLMLDESGIEPQALDWSSLQKQTKGLSGSDIKNGVQAGLDKPLLDLQVNRLWKVTKSGFFEPCDKNTSLEENVVCMNLDDIPDKTVRASKPKVADILNALSKVKPTVSQNDVLKYQKYNEEF